MQGDNNFFGSFGAQSCPQEVLSKIVDLVGAPVFITKNGGFGLYDQKIIYANKAFCDATGYNENEIIGRSPEFLYSQRNGGGAVLEFYKNCHIGQAFKSSFSSFKKDSTEQIVTIEVTPVFDKEKGGISYISYLSNVEVVEEEQKTPTIEAETPSMQEVQPQVIAQVQEPVIEQEIKEVATQSEPAIEEDFDVPVAPIVTAESERLSILEEIRAELRGEAISFGKEQQETPAIPEEVQSEIPEEDPFGLDDYIFDDEDGDDLKEEYKLNAEIEAVPVAEEIADNENEEDSEFFSKLGSILDTNIEQETAEQPIEAEEAADNMSVEEIVSQINNEEESVSTIAEAVEEEPYQNSQIAELIRKLEEKKEEAKQDQQLQQVKADSEDPEVVEQDLDYYAKTRFLSNMSHDLRTPLNAIIGFSEVIRDQLFGPIDNQRYISYANDIYKSGQELLATVSEILELSEIEHEEAPLEEEDFSLTGTIEEVLDLLSARAFQTDVKLMKKLKADNIVCRGDRKKIKQAVAGVINNAIKSSPSGGTLEISSEMGAEGFQMMVYIRSANMIAAKSNLGSLLGTVTSKIESEYPEILLAHKFIEAHDGEFSIFNSATSGTEISITLPAERLSKDASGQEYLKVIN